MCQREGERLKRIPKRTGTVRVVHFKVLPTCLLGRPPAMHGRPTVRGIEGHHGGLEPEEGKER